MPETGPGDPVAERVSAAAGVPVSEECGLGEAVGLGGEANRDNVHACTRSLVSTVLLFVLFGGWGRWCWRGCSRWC